MPQEIRWVLAILQAAFAAAAAAGAAASTASVVAIVGGGAERDAVVGTAVVVVSGGNPGQAAAIGIRAGGAAVAGAVAGGVGIVWGSVGRGVSQNMRRRQLMLRQWHMLRYVLLLLLSDLLLGKTTRSMRMVRRLLVLVMVGMRMVRMLLGVRVLMHVRDVSVFSPVVHAPTEILRCGRAGEDIRIK